MISIIRGIINVIVRLTNRLVFVSLRFAFSNRSSSCFSRLNARITEIPVRISRLTRFRRSIRSCSFLNFGIATQKRTATRIRIAATAIPRIQVMDASVFSTFSTPPIPRIGAYKTIRNNMVNTICTCWISFVLLVIRDAVEKLSISLLEKDNTFRYTLFLRS